MQAPEVGARAHAELERAALVEAPEPLVLHERVPVRAHAVVGLEGRDSEPVAPELLVGLELHEPEVERDPPDERAQRLEERLQARRAVHGERALAAAERECLQHSREAQEVVRVEVGDVDLLEIDQPDRAQELSLRALAAVEEEPIAAAAHEQRGQAPRRRGRGSGCADEEDVEIHPPIFAPPIGRGPRPRRRSTRCELAHGPSCGAAGGGGPSGCRG